MVLNEFYNGTSGNEIYHVIPEIVFKFHYAYIVPKPSPFIQVLDTTIRDFQEFGFKKKSKLDHRNYIYQKEIRNMKLGNFRKSTKVVITMKHMKHVFIFYLACTIVCIVVFLLEIYSYE